MWDASARPSLARRQRHRPLMGTIIGHVHYMGPTPVNPIIRMGADPRCNKLYVGKRPTSPTFVVGADGAMANALVNLDGSFPATAVSNMPVVLGQKDWQYAPRLVAARVGQTLQVRNDDPTDHNVHASSVVGNDFNTTQPIKSMPFEFVTVASIVTHWRQWSAFHTDGRATPRIGTGGS